MVAVFKRLTWLIALVATVNAHDVARAGSADTGTYGATFLRIPVGPRSMALPGIVVGMQPDASLIFSNPAPLSSITGNEVYLTRSAWLDDLSMSAVGLVLSAPMKLKWSFGSRLLYSGGLQGYSNSGQIISEDSYYDVAFTTGVSRELGKGLGIGLGATYLREHLPLEDANGVVFSAGAVYRLGSNRFEIAMLDFGGSLDFPGHTYPIDNRITFGYARAIRQAWGTFDVGAQVTSSRSEYQLLRVGAAYRANPYLTLRTGYDYAMSGPSSTQTPLSAGVGFHLGSLNLDYSYTSRDYFSNTHTLSFAYAFGDGVGRHVPEPRPTSPRTQSTSPNRTTGVASTEGTPPKGAKAPVSGPAASSPPVVAGPAAKTASERGYAVIAGIHSRTESAQAELRALSLLKIPAVVEASGTRFRVVVGRYKSREDAEHALEKYRKQGHVFSVVAE